MPARRSVDRPTTSASATPMRAAISQHQRPRQLLAEHRDRVGADAEEGGGGERDVARRAGEQRPGRRQHDVAERADAEREVVAAREPAATRQRAPPQSGAGGDRAGDHARGPAETGPSDATAGRRETGRSSTASVRPGSTRRATSVSTRPSARPASSAPSTVADAAHDDDDQRLHGEDHAHRRR